MKEKIRNSRDRREGFAKSLHEKFRPGQISVRRSLFSAIVLLGLSFLEYFLLVLLLGIILKDIPDEIRSMLLRNKLSYFVFMCALKIIPFLAFVFPYAYYAKPEGILKSQWVSKKFTIGILMISGGIAVLASNFATGVLHVIEELLGIHCLPSGDQVNSGVAMFYGLDRIFYMCL